MRLRTEELSGHLSRNLAQIYLITGDEPLQLGEGADAVRHRALAAGYTERQVLEQGPGFDWGLLRGAADTLSLFAEKRVIDLRLATPKIGADGSNALVAYSKNPPPDTLLLITSPRLDRSQLAGKWVKTIESRGVLIQVWPIDARRLPGWIEQRLRARGMNPESGVASMLAERVEGNLLAAAQEIDKLLLLLGPGPVNRTQLVAAVADSARFDVYKLVDTCLTGGLSRALRILSGLRAEGTAAPVILWALSREIRALASMAYLLSQGKTPSEAMAAHRVWENRKAVVALGLQRLSLRQWRELLVTCTQADRLIKGRAQGDPWLTLSAIACGIAGVNPVPR